MHITMTDMMPVSLCLATHELFDARRYQQNFCDWSLLRARDSQMQDAIWPMKKELGSTQFYPKYIEGHKAVIISNIDKIISLVTGRYASLSVKSVEAISREGKILMRSVLGARSFEDIHLMEPAFKSKILLPVYELFMESNRKTLQV